MQSPPVALLLLVALAGCTTHAPPRPPPGDAFRAGQQHALEQLYQARFPVVTVLGPVRNPTLDWTAELTLARAIVAADYQGIRDPRGIRLHRGQQQWQIDPRQLLAGQDWPLQPGDRIEILP